MSTLLFVLTNIGIYFSRLFQKCAHNKHVQFQNISYSRLCNIINFPEKEITVKNKMSNSLNSDSISIYSNLVSIQLY